MSLGKLLALLLATLILHTRAEGGEDDLVADVPGLAFKPNFKTYSGYLYANDKKTWKMHYMMTTSRANRSTDPIVFWNSGGPGCSSLSGAFQETGPFYADAGGERLFENIYSWNREANMVYLESPIGVGFSYDTTNVKYRKADDEKAALQNFAAIADFFARSHPEFKDRDFYLAGESYAGVYTPTAAAKIAENLDKFPNKNFRGVLIGNGYMHVKLNFNTVVLWAYYHGLVGEDEWKKLKGCCTKVDGEDTDACDWYHLATTKNRLDFSFDKSTECGKILDSIVNSEPALNRYSVYDDCYSENASDFRQLQLVSSSEDAKQNPGLFFNRHSTDPNQGYPCYNEETSLAYVKRDDFAEAFHIDKAFYDGGGVFQDCNHDLFTEYGKLYDDMTPFFEKILDNIKGFRVLIFSGDVDRVCNFIGNGRFVELLATKRGLTSKERKTWYHRKRIGGYVQRFTDTSKNSTLDVLTLKGAGHLTMEDRPGPTLQMFVNFLNGAKSYGELNANDQGVPENLPYVDSGASLSSISTMTSLVFVFFQWLRI